MRTESHATVVASATITLHGDIDRAAEGDVTTAYDEAKVGANGQLTLDFGDVSYINSTGIAVIVGLLAKARKDGLTIEAYGLSDHYRHVFEITRLADFMTIHTDGIADAAGGGR
ncbi:MAG: STAS domain-containing protein [Actinomycetota bacterium]|nr:STAS domain-containing protein [Actinomycetota bacterium]